MSAAVEFNDDVLASIEKNLEKFMILKLKLYKLDIEMRYGLYESDESVYLKKEYVAALASTAMKTCHNRYRVTDVFL